MRATVNGHAPVWPQAEAVSDGKWVQCYRDGKRVFTCNATYARANFVVIELDNAEWLASPATLRM